MRTKAEALANPTKGDKWKKSAIRTVLFSDGDMVRYSGKSGKVSYTWLATLQRWAAGAEYLGTEASHV